MLTIKAPLGAAAALCALILAASPAEALVVRAWVSGKGSDVAGCGAPTNACRTLQYAHDSVVAAGGEIDILDPAGYGTLTITKAISVVNDGVGTAGVQANAGNAININAGTNDVVRLKGLNVEGLGTATNGIVFNTGRSLTIEDCTVRDFTADQVVFAPAKPSYLYVTNSRLEQAGAAGFGLVIQPVIATGPGVVHVTLEHVEIASPLSGGDGVYIDSAEGGGSASLKVTIADSIISDNGRNGINVFGTTASVIVRNTTVSDNGAAGVEAANGGSILVAHSTFGGNGTAFDANGGTISSYGDNNVNGNLGSTPTAATFH
jgi:Right handed beta helix region